FPPNRKSEIFFQISPVPLTKRMRYRLSYCADGTDVRSVEPSGKGFNKCLNPYPVMILTLLYWEEKTGSTRTYGWGGPGLARARASVFPKASPRVSEPYTGVACRSTLRSLTVRKAIRRRQLPSSPRALRRARNIRFCW